MTLGAAIFGAGVLIWVTWLILRPSGQDFWSWIGIVGVALTIAGAVSLMIGFVMPDEHEDESQLPERQSLKSDSPSINVQAGRDILQAGRDITIGDRSGKNDAS